MKKISSMGIFLCKVVVFIKFFISVILHPKTSFEINLIQHNLPSENRLCIAYVQALTTEGTAVTNEINPTITSNYIMTHKKPLAEIERLLKNLSPASNKLETKNKQLLNYSVGKQHNCFLLHKGSVTLYRSIDGMVLNSESAPYLFGISTQLLESDYLYIRTQEGSEVSVISIEEANQIIAREDLWKSLSTLLIYTATRVYDHCTKISSLSSYKIICYQLYELMNETKEIRDSISVVSYIKNRTFISRSSIMKILAQLKAGGYIVTDKGLLKSINDIPSKY